MKIEVTQEDIDNGVAKDSCNCPVALAIKRKFKNKVKCSICAFYGMIFTPDGSKRSTLWAWGSNNKQDVRYWIESFDNGKPVCPFIFFI